MRNILTKKQVKEIINKYSLKNEKDVIKIVKYIKEDILREMPISYKGNTDYMREWQKRPLKEIYPIVYLDVKPFPLMENDLISVKKSSAALAYDMEGIRDVLGVRIINTDDDYSGMFLDFSKRGVKDILIVYIDNPSGSYAIKEHYPNTDIQTCIIHQIKNSVKFVSCQDRKWIMKEIKHIYEAPDEEQGLIALNQFISRWESKYTYLAGIWRNNWSNITGLYKYPQDIRKLIYNTNLIETFNSSVEKSSHLKHLFPSEEDVFMLYYQTFMNFNKKRTQKLKYWNTIVQGLLNYFPERLGEYI